MAIDLLVIGSSADRSGADVTLPIALGEIHITGNGAPGTGTQWYPKAVGAIKAAFTRSETAAMVELRFHDTDDANYVKLAVTSLQTDPIRSQIMNYFHYAINEGMAIEASGENASAVLDVLGLYTAKKAGEEPPSPIAPVKLPKGAIMVRATSTFTHVADTLVTGTIVFDDFVPLRNTWYKIIGMRSDSATGCLTRLKFLEGPNIADRPGVPTSDTSTGLEYQMLWGDFGEFRGQTLPQCQTIAVGADAVTNLYFVLVPKAGGRAGV